MHKKCSNRVATLPGKPGKSLTLRENLENSGNLYIFLETQGKLRELFEKELQFRFCSSCVGIDFNFSETVSKFYYFQFYILRETREKIFFNSGKTFNYSGKTQGNLFSIFCGNLVMLVCVFFRNFTGERLQWMPNVLGISC